MLSREDNGTVGPETARAIRQAVLDAPPAKPGIKGMHASEKARPRVIEYHGLWIPLLCRLFGFLRWCGPYAWCSWWAGRIKAKLLGEERTLGPTYSDMAAAIVQGLLFVSPWFPVWLLGFPVSCFPWIPLCIRHFPWFPVWLLCDQLVYLVNVLWFDDLRIQPDVRVWSHRRILLHSIIAFTASIAVFALAYQHLGVTAVHGTPATFPQMLWLSYQTACTLNPPDKEYWELSRALRVTWGIQIAVSLFFVAVVLSTLAAVGYTREEKAKCEYPKSGKD